MVVSLLPAELIEDGGCESAEDDPIVVVRPPIASPATDRFNDDTHCVVMRMPDLQITRWKGPDINRNTTNGYNHLIHELDSLSVKHEVKVGIRVLSR
jgi:hypothetical protein